MPSKLIYTGGSESNTKTKEEFVLLLSTFHQFVEDFYNDADYDSSFEDLCSLRFSFLFDRVLNGLQLDFSQALDILRNAKGLDSDLLKFRDIVVAAVDNLVDFAVYEEFEMLNSLPTEESDEDETASDVFETYNLTYAATENNEVLYAAEMAFWWVGIENNQILTYTTQQDERVRDSHLLLEGYTASKQNFPPELIPPIDWACRCYLLSDVFGIVASASVSKNLNDFSDVVNPIFKESLATGGRIFSDTHPYFQVDEKVAKKLNKIVIKIKDKLYAR